MKTEDEKIGYGDGKSEGNPAGNITYVLNNNVSSNDIIKVKPGTYNTTIGETFPLNITDHANVTIVFTGSPANTIISGTKTHSGIKITTSNNTINGFTISNFADEWDEGGILLTGSSNNNITSNNIRNNHGGILLYSSSDNTENSENGVVKRITA